jgi:hypothetical protein
MIIYSASAEWYESTIWLYLITINQIRSLSPFILKIQSKKYIIDYYRLTTFEIPCHNQKPDPAVDGV